MDSMNWFDIIILALILVFGLKGVTSGIIKEIFGILGLIGGLACAVRYKHIAGAWISENIYDLSSGSSISGSGTEILAGFLAILFGVWIICLIIGEILSKLVKASGLGFINKFGGFIFSSAKIFLIFSVIAVMIKTSAFLNNQTKPYFEKSVVYPYLLASGQYIMQISENEEVKNTINGIKDKIDNSIKIDINITDKKTEENKTFIDTNQTTENNTTGGAL